jgi:hypothetical protein
MACDAYEVGVLPPKHRKDLRAERTRTFTADQVVKSIPWLRRMNAQDYDIYIRPAPLADGSVQPLVFIDDITGDAVARMREAGFRFSALVESSPGNFHGWTPRITVWLDVGEGRFGWPRGWVCGVRAFAGLSGAG